MLAAPNTTVKGVLVGKKGAAAVKQALAQAALANRTD